MELPKLLVELQEGVRKAEKNKSLDILVYMKNDYKSGMSTHDMETKYSEPPINVSITNTTIAEYMKKFCHIQLRQGTYNTKKKSS